MDYVVKSSGSANLLKPLAIAYTRGPQYKCRTDPKGRCYIYMCKQGTTRRERGKDAIKRKRDERSIKGARVIRAGTHTKTEIILVYKFKGC